MSDAAWIAVALAFHGLCWFFLVLTLLDQRSRAERSRERLDALGNTITGKVP